MASNFIMISQHNLKVINLFLYNLEKIYIGYMLQWGGCAHKIQMTSY